MNFKIIHTSGVFVRSFITLSVAGFLVACAKERPIDYLPDANQERISKSVFNAYQGLKNTDGKYVQTGDPSQNNVWLSKVTVVKTSHNAGFAFVGLQSDLKAGYFEFTRDQLRYISETSPYEGPQVAENALINSWQVAHTDIRLAETDGKVTNREEEDRYKPWQDRRFITVNWASAKISEATTFPWSTGRATTLSGWTKRSAYLVEGSDEFTKDHINFTIAVDYELSPLRVDDIRRGVQGDLTYTVHYKYSFLRRQPSTYQAMRYQGEFDPLMSRYGYFQTVVESLDENGRYKNTFLVNRWHPEKTHIIYFTENFPEEHKWIFNHPEIGVIQRTNDLFAENGLKLRFEIRDNDGSQKFGDLRYSFINFISELDGRAPLGYGPSDADPLTGEIIAANTMVWTGSLGFYMQLIKDQLEREEGRAESSSLYQAMKVVLEEENVEQWTKTAQDLDPSREVGRLFHDMLPRLTFGFPGWHPFTYRDYPGVRDATAGSTPVNIPGVPSQDRVFSALDLLRVEPQAARSEVEPLLAVAQQVMQDQAQVHPRDTTIYPIEMHLADIRTGLKNGLDPKAIINSILYQVSIHEFGHNLNLRHNFYGSIDKGNFERRSHITLPDGRQVEWEQQVSNTTSVMEYMRLLDELQVPFDWEPYDKAALVYAYSSGQVDLARVNQTRYLYCTDEHTIFNALCNRFDYGSTPSEIAMSMIEAYDEGYWTRNFRYGRAYWDTSGYAARVYSTMADMKKFFMGLRTTFLDGELRQILMENQHLSEDEVTEYVRFINKDFKQAVKLSVAFYEGVIRQSTSERHYRSEYDPWTGALTRVGIAPDKVFAMQFLAGDMPFVYNPNRLINYASFLVYLNDPDIGYVLDKVMDNSIRSRPAMEPWFIGFARSLFAQNAYSPAFMSDSSLIDKVRVACYRPETFASRFGIDPNRYQPRPGEPEERLDVALIRGNQQVQDPYFAGSGDRLGVAHIDGNYFVASEIKNPYAFSLFINLSEDVRFSSATGTSRDDIVEVHRLYNFVRQQRVPECQ